MKVRTAVLAAVVVTASVGVTGAGAAPRRRVPPPVCNLLMDAKNDIVPADASLDVHSADIASDARNITTVVRLGGPADATSPSSPAGRMYTIAFYGQGGQTPVFMSYIVSATGSGASYGYYNQQSQQNRALGGASLKTSGNTVVLTTPISVFAPYGNFRPGARITRLKVVTDRLVGTYLDAERYVYIDPDADATGEGKPYTAGARSCVKVGG